MFQPRKYNLFIQTTINIGLVFIVVIVCFLLNETLSHRIVALLLLLLVSVLAMFFDIIPVLLASTLSALAWNFFFIPPIFTFHISNTEDTLLFILYFVVALVNTVLNFKIRQEERKTRDKEEKEQTLRLYDTLINSLSHELRTPIATILGAVDTLKGSKNISKENQLELLNQIDSASLRLNVQVGNLLNMSRLESGLLKFNKQWLNINEVIRASIDKFAEIKTHSFVFEENTKMPLCELDELLMEQVLYNIFNNAILYTPAKTKINIFVKITENVLEIDIKDNGPGISEKYLPQIFNKFYRLPDSKTGGSGLGLSIVKGFVEVQNGSISAHNLNPNGLQICIKLPVQTTYLNQINV
jgi:two-component system, OmpR family, sensor histidine kinase KdpD